jgi:hypothetical protein
MKKDFDEPHAMEPYMEYWSKYNDHKHTKPEDAKTKILTLFKLKVLYSLRI